MKGLQNLICIFGFMMLMQGCYQVADNSDIIKAQHFCKNLGGVNYVRIDFIGQELIRCMNGDREFVSQVTLPVNYKY